MKILHFLWSGAIGGAERAVYQLVREQMRHPGCRVGVMFGQAHGVYFDRIRDLGCPILCADLGNGREVFKLRAIVHQIGPYDIHHFHNIEPLQFIASVLSGDKVRVYTERGGNDVWPVMKRMRHKLGGIFLNRYFAAYSANTAHAARVAASRYGLSIDEINVTYNGIEFSFLCPARTRLEVREELGVDDMEVLIGTSAHLRSWKRIHRIFEACALLKDCKPRVLVVGDGPDRSRLEGVTKELGVASRVSFVGMKQDVADYLAAMDIFVLPSTELESFGNAVIEAMALGIPSVVFRDSPGLCEHIVHGTTGFVVDDVEGLAHTIKILAHNPSFARKVGTQGASHVRSKYTLARMAEAYRQLYEQAVWKVNASRAKEIAMTSVKD
jgi:glycosyltransferase involved in cell wall biosynthesis